MSYAGQQHGRDLRERLNSRRREKIRHESFNSVRSRSRSTDHAEAEAAGGGRPARHHRRDGWPRADSGSPRSRQPTGDARTPPRSSSSHASFKKETDPVILARRQKQLDYGKNTLCYQEYIKTVPKHKREAFHPRTPVKLRQTSRRRWDSAVKKWRIHLHYWNDPVKLAELRKRPDSDSASSDGESAAFSPRRRPVKPQRPALEGAASPPPSAAAREPSGADRSAVRRGPRESEGCGKQEPVMKQEPLDPEVARVKQEPLGPEVARVKQEPLDPELTAVKQEGLDPEVARVKQEGLGPGFPAVKQEPGKELEMDREPEQSEMARDVNGTPAEEKDVFEYDPSSSWADDVEGLAEELAGDTLV